MYSPRDVPDAHRRWARAETRCNRIVTADSGRRNGLKVSVTARHAEVSTSVREYAELKAGKLLRYFDRLQFVEVILDREHQTWKA
ncbi:MAG: HPF/RaiA family ribosome-associated protein, partial [Hyphomicrobiaceae bacterium]|nr:HPF/RaiA family ribosome-associated protein [Hyphomicrobiaceae bacterium]